MKKLLFLLLLVPVLSWSQSKRKKRIAEEKANATLVANLKTHVTYLADDQLEGRLTGSKGEELAAQYIIKQYEQLGIAAKGTKGYEQIFDINEGKQIDATTKLVIDEKILAIRKDYFPLSYSPNKTVKGKPAMILSEKSQPWFFDVKETLEEQKNNPHFDLEAVIKKQVETVVSKGATALFVYNSSSLNDNIQFNKNDRSALLPVPVIYITKEGLRKHFSDEEASIDIVLTVSLSEKKRKGRNIIAFIDNKAANTVIIGAHYDHLGYGEDKTALDTFHAIHNGADDNASGTAALLELARLLKEKSPSNNNYLLMHFSGEELGLLGSKYWLENPTVKVTPNYMINMDMVGRYDTAHKLTVGGYGTSPVWGEVWKTLTTGLITKFDSTGSGPSDHASFYRANIPVQFFFTGSHADYHKISDDAEKINYTGQRDIVKLIYELIAQTDTKGKLTFTKTAEPQMGQARRFTVSLGVMPDYGYTGTGMRIDGVSPGKLGERIGLQAGDVLLQLGNVKFIDVKSYSEALSSFKAGDKTKLRIRRGTEDKEFDVQF